MNELSLKNCRLDGRYDVQELLGRGSYAEIYLARDIAASSHSPHSHVVIKALNVFLQDDLDSDLERTLVENFQNEAIALDRVRHPNVINRLGHGTARDLRNTIFHYLVLEYLPGGDLAKLCRHKGLPLEAAMNYLEQVCAGLAHAHSCGIIHRDIKPQNLLLSYDQKTVKIADFGVARLTQSDSPITRVGTNMYAPPEHSPIHAESYDVMTVTELTPAADIYSLAKSAYVIVTGESPRRFTGQTISELPFSFSDKSWAGELLRVLRKATQSDPKQRQQSVTEFWQDLTEVRQASLAEEKETETQVAMRAVPAPQASVLSDFSPLAPARPRFNTTNELKSEVLGTHQQSPRLVVNMSGGAVNRPTANGKHSPDYVPPKPLPIRKRSFLRRAAVFLILICALAGALYATQNYIRTGRIFPKITNPFGKPEGEALIDVNLRSTPGVENPPVGLVPKESRVRILDTNDNWYYVEIIKSGRPNENTDSAVRGWVNKKYINIMD